MQLKLLLRAFLRTLIVLLALTALALTVASFYAPQIVSWAARTFSSPPEATPPPPTLLAPRGEMPSGVVGLEEWVQYQGEGYQLVGSGFFLRLSDGAVVAVTTAHATPPLGTPNNTLEHIAFALNGQPDHAAEFDTLYGPPGTPRTGFDLSIDYVLLRVNQALDATLVLTPDPRGAPQPGERVLLFSGLGDENGGRRVLEGTVQSAEAAGVWVLMDDSFDAGRMSGSPLISQHTGQVVGMAIAVTARGDRIMIGFHPIGHIAQIAEAAREFPKIAAYQR